MAVKKIRRYAPIVGVLALAAFLLAPLVLTTPRECAVDDSERFRLSLNASLRMQYAWADSTPLENSKAVSTTQLLQFPMVRPRMTVVLGDTAWGKIVVPAMDDGDMILGIIRIDTISGEANIGEFYDIADSCYFDADTIQPWVATDSGTVMILFNDAN